MCNTPPNAPSEESLEDKDTDNVSILDIILDEVRKIRETQEKHEDELERIKKQLGGVTRNLRIVYAAQQEHGKKLGSLEHRCDRCRGEPCLSGEGDGLGVEVGGKS